MWIPNKCRRFFFKRVAIISDVARWVKMLCGSLVILVGLVVPLLEGVTDNQAKYLQNCPNQVMKGEKIVYQLGKRHKALRFHVRLKCAHVR